MPPKKGKAKAAASQLIAAQHRQTRSASREIEPTPEPQRQTRKRRHSDASSVSDQSQSAPATTPSKRRKRKAAADIEHELLAEVPEVEEDEDEEDELTAPTPDEIDSVQVSQSSVTKHVHFNGRPDETINNVTVNFDKSTATHITPHPQKMAVKRRITASPYLNGASQGESKRIKQTSLRHSLPPSLSQDAEPTYFVEEREFAPLSEVLRERVRRRARIHELLAELQSHQEQGRTKKAEAVEAELAQLRKEQDAAIASMGDEDYAMLDDNMLVLASQEETAYRDLPQDSVRFGVDGLAASTDSRYLDGSIDEELSLSRSQARSKDADWENERQKFQDAIVSLSQEANEAKTRLQILEIELQGLGFAEEGVDAAAVLLSIRESFNRVRENLESVLPDTVPEGASNEDIVNILVANVKEFVNRMRVQDKELFDKSTLAADLGKQIRGLIEHLAEAQYRRDQLQKSWQELDQTNETKERDIEDLQEELDATTKERDTLQDELDVKTEEARVLKNENIDFAASVDRLTASLQKYREEETRLQELITKMEEEHKTSVSHMNKEREETVRDLEDRLDEQFRSREDAEQLNEERQAMITGLELRVEEIEGERDSLREELEEITAQRDYEREAKESVEADLQAKEGEVTGMEARVDRLEEELADLNDQLEELRRLNDAERQQREAAETDLDDRNAEVEDLNYKLQEQGKQANELRQKLFEVQQANEHKIEELQKAASERDEQYQADISDEVERREGADSLAQQRATTILELETRIEETEERMRVLLEEHDERIEELEQEIVQKDSEIETLRTELDDAQDSYETQVAQSTQQRQEQDGSIASLKTTISQYEAQIATMKQDAVATSDLHNSQIEDHNARIAELNHGLAELNAQVDQLQEDKLSLEKRVEQEAEQMLTLQDEKESEIDALKATIRDKQAKILNVEEKAVEADRRWQEVLEARDEEIASLKTSGEETTQTIATLTSDMDAVKTRFRDYVRKSTGTIAELRKDAEAHRAKAGEAAAELEDDGERALAEIESMGVFGQVQITTTKSLQPVHEQVTRKTRGRKKRVVDSGIGFAADEEDESTMLA